MALMMNPLLTPFMPTELAYVSAENVAAGPSSQSSASTRYRRSNGSSSDEAPVPDQDGLIEEDLRAGGPKLCDAPCITFRTIPPDHPYYNEIKGHQGYLLITELLGICRRADLRYTEIDFCGRQSAWDSSQAPVLTLLVTATRSALTEGWVDVARKLLNHLHGKGLYRISVEIMDLRFESRLAIHPCRVDDTVYPVWRPLVEDILAAIDVKGIMSIGCFRIGADADPIQCPVTILVGADYRVSRDWRPVRDRMVDFLGQYELRNVSICIRKDAPIRGAGCLELRPANSDDCRLDPNLGSSISPRAMKSARGTLGGWVEVRNAQTGQWVPFALTCAHCCLPAREGLSMTDSQSK